MLFVLTLQGDPGIEGPIGHPGPKVSSSQFLCAMKCHRAKYIRSDQLICTYLAILTLLALTDNHICFADNQKGRKAQTALILC